jgi:hypothetical protein
MLHSTLTASKITIRNNLFVGALFFTMEPKMRKLLLIGLGLCAIGALWKAEEEEDGLAIAMSPFLAALAIETGIFLLRRHQNLLLSEPDRG